MLRFPQKRLRFSLLSYSPAEESPFSSKEAHPSLGQVRSSPEEACLRATGSPCQLVGPFHFIRNDLNIYFSATEIVRFYSVGIYGFLVHPSKRLIRQLEDIDACFTAMGSPCWLV